MKKRQNKVDGVGRAGKPSLLFLMKRLQTEPAVIVKRAIRGLSRRSLAQFVAQASGAARLKGAVSVMVTDNRQMRALNAQFRGKNQATDVLSFPPLAVAYGLAGDIAISLDIATQNARLLGHSLPDEVQILVLHGILHLAGYDHEHDDGEMARKEARLRRRFGLPTALIERAEKKNQVQ
jgi:probable rRNA maturation factor